jgi:hypothetical protein
MRKQGCRHRTGPDTLGIAFSGRAQARLVDIASHTGESITGATPTARRLFSSKWTSWSAPDRARKGIALGRAEAVEASALVLETTLLELYGLAASPGLSLLRSQSRSLQRFPRSPSDTVSEGTSGINALGSPSRSHGGASP